MKYLIVGLGNIGDDYAHTRHNIGFDVVDALVEKYKSAFTADRYADIAEISLRGRQIIAIKPNTYMNLSGKPYKYWLDKLEIQKEHSIAVVDELALPYGS
jgi:PTH1 family peptidyl-tRNA hydrolase